MNFYQIFFMDKKGYIDTVITGFNGSFKDAKQYYLKQWFNFGIEHDYMMLAFRVKILT